jgi:exopolyphosphatase/guanosine-5'-triphosphate,3'-diphosphate pyrophosphatase
MEVVRLGEGVDRTGRLAPAALARTFAACEVYAATIRAAGVECVRFVATSASRDVENRDQFVAGVVARLGIEPEVVTGDEERDRQARRLRHSLRRHIYDRSGEDPRRESAVYDI